MQAAFDNWEISTHASLAGRDNRRRFDRPRQIISTHASLAGRDVIYRFQPASIRISTHASLAGRDPRSDVNAILPYTFLPTRPLRDATLIFSARMARSRFLPTRPLRDATLFSEKNACNTSISTHASLAGRDYAAGFYQQEIDISTHASLAGRDLRHFSTLRGWKFLPTRPLRDATPCRRALRAARSISTHASLAGRDRIESLRCRRGTISTHASLAGRDWPERRHARPRKDFYPRVPCGTRRCGGRTGRGQHSHFYPRVPCGTRQQI